VAGKMRDLWRQTAVGMALVAMPCKKAGDRESRRMGRCRLAGVGLAQRIVPLYIYLNYFQKDLN
jgi:hypothetical protein